MKTQLFSTVMLSSGMYDNDGGLRQLVQVHPLVLERNRIQLGDGIITLGRSDACDVIFDDESISRKHAKIYSDSSGYTIEDLGSTNGVLVNDQRVRKQLLRSGDRLQLGQRIFRFLADTDVENQYHETVYSMMTRDGLTSVFNKRYLLECLDREVARSKRHRRPLAVIMIDIDNFKFLNDTYGHLAGDEILRELAGRLTSNLRGDEVLARFGGEEFAIINGEADLESAAQVAERCRAAVASEPFITCCGPLEVTISLGVAVTQNDDSVTSPDKLLAEADVRLYEAKRAGRNRVVAR